MEYPKDFPPESRAAVAAEKIRAGKDFDQVRDPLSRGTDIEEQVRKYVLRQFLVFVQEASKLGKIGIWHVDRVESAALEYLRRATIDAVYSKGRGLGGRWVSNVSGGLTLEICRQFEKSSEWQQYQDILLQVAEEQAPPAASAEAKATTEPEQRRGYRAEVRLWMAGQKIGKVSEAARHLGLRERALIDHVCSGETPLQRGDPKIESFELSAARARNLPVHPSARPRSPPTDLIDFTAG
jgi:hypothetical protein